MAEKKEPSLFAKLWSSILVNDLPTAAKNVLLTVVGPKTKEMINTILKALVDSMFGNGTSGAKPAADNRTSVVPYQSYWAGNRSVPKVSSYDVMRPMQEDIWFPTEQEARECCMYITDIIQKEGFATVNKLYDKAQLTVPHTAENWGWTDFGRARVIPGTNDKGEDGWILSTPRPIGLER